MEILTDYVGINDAGFIRLLVWHPPLRWQTRSSFYKFKKTAIAIGTLMIPQIATQIYTSLDKPILGLFAGSAQVSFYDNSQRISNMILGVITSISLVIMPKMASEGKETQKVVMKNHWKLLLC